VKIELIILEIKIKDKITTKDLGIFKINNKRIHKIKDLIQMDQEMIRIIVTNKEIMRKDFSIKNLIILYLMMDSIRKEITLLIDFKIEIFKIRIIQDLIRRMISETIDFRII